MKGTGNLKLQIKIDGKTYEAEVEVLDETDSQPDDVPYPHYSAIGQPVLAPGAYVPAATHETHSADDKQYRSPVTGLVIKVNVAPGQQVQPSDVIMVLESMKMETSVIAHHAGRVKSVAVAPGGPVKLHQVLVELE